MMNFKKEFSFHDTKGYLVDVELKLVGGEFSMSGNYNGGGGQCFDRVEPRTPAQTTLIEYWKKYHLNGMNAGTPEQMEIGKHIPAGNNYEERCEYLRQHDVNGNELSIVQYTKCKEAIEEYKTKKIISDDIFISAYCVNYEGQPYIFGTSWIKYHLPDNFDTTLNALIEEIEREEIEYKGTTINVDMIDDQAVLDKASELNCSTAKIIALCLQCEVGIESLDTLSKPYGENYFEIEGETYLVCTDEEANEAHLESIKSLVDDIGWEGFKDSKDIDVKLDGWGNVIISKEICIGENERGNSLNSWDGNEYTQVVNGETFYLYKQ